MSEIPAGATVPQDHLKPAAQIEAERAKTLTITWHGEEFVVPAMAEDWKATTTLAFERSQGVTGIIGVIGEARWGELVKTIDPTNAQVNELFELIGKAMGFKATGE